MHPGNHTWTHIHTKMGYKYEREVVEAGLTESWDVAEHFGVPDEMVRLQLPLIVEFRSSETAR